MKRTVAKETGPSVRPAEVLLVDFKGAAALLAVSVRHFQALDNNGRLGPIGISLGRSKRWRVDELRMWVQVGCPPRDRWMDRQGQDGVVRLTEQG